jgi:ankyrin repeat protein
MKDSWLKLASLLLLAVVGCGKKAGTVDSNPTSAIVPLDAEVDFKARKELLRTVSTNDLSGLMEVLKYHPELDLNKEFEDGNTPFIIAIINNSITVRNYFIEKGVLIDKPNVNKETALMMAVKGAWLNSVKVLIDRKVDLNRRDNTGEAALHKAIKLQGESGIAASNKEIWEDSAIALIKAGASIELTDQNGRNAFQLAQDYPNQKILNLIKGLLDVETGTPQISTFRSILQAGETKSLSSVLKRFPQLPVDYEAINPLVLAMDNPDQSTTLNMVRLLLQYSANINGPSDAEITPLIKAIFQNNITLTMLLLEGKANPGLFDRQGKSALYHAIELLEPEAVQNLLNASAPTAYTVKKNNKTIDFKACGLAKSTEGSLSSAEDKEKILKIKKSLGCRSLWWPF